MYIYTYVNIIYIYVIHIVIYLYLFIHVAFICNLVGAGFQGVLWRQSGWVWQDCNWPVLVGLSRQRFGKVKLAEQEL